MPSHSDALLSGNLLLSALRVPDQALLKPHLELKTYARGEALFEVGEYVSYIAFPLGQCVAALVIELQDGRAVETATVGHEGAIGGVVSQGSISLKNSRQRSSIMEGRAPENV